MSITLTCVWLAAAILPPVAEEPRPLPPAYVKAQNRVEKRCSTLDAAVVAELRAVIEQGRESSETKGAIIREGRAWCKGRGVLPEYEACLRAAVALEFAPKRVAPPPLRLRDFSPEAQVYAKRAQRERKAALERCNHQPRGRTTGTRKQLCEAEVELLVEPRLQAHVGSIGHFGRIRIVGVADRGQTTLIQWPYDMRQLEQKRYLVYVNGRASKGAEMINGELTFPGPFKLTAATPHTPKCGGALYITFEAHPVDVDLDAVRAWLADGARR